jgi:hypothetical protein
MAGVLAGRGFTVTSLVHELPTIIEENWGAPRYEQLRDQSATVVFPSSFVHDETAGAFGRPAGRTLIRPQGLYQPIRHRSEARAAVRERLGLPASARIVLNIGYADLRKGFDVFVTTAARVVQAASDTHFVWLGDISPSIAHWVRRDMARLQLANVHLQPFDPDVAFWLSGADAFFLSSREDPFPSVVLEALAAGLPVVAFKGASGAAELLADRDLGVTVPYLDTDAAAEALKSELGTPQAKPSYREAHRRDVIARRFGFADYCADLLHATLPGYRRVSVVVPNYNYARHIEERLQSILRQTYPVYEILVLDDASTDGSRDVITRVIAESGRLIRTVFNDANSGSVSRQWLRGLEQATGDLLWIAEADDLSDERFLERMVERLSTSPDAAFAFCDSVALDAAGTKIYENYKGYYREFGDTGLDQDGRFDTSEFLRRFLGARNLVLNASAVVWNTRRLREAFARLGDAAFDFTCAGDWRLYVEACRVPGTVHYVADPLNQHRRHDASVTHALAKQSHLREIVAVHEAVLAHLPDCPETRADIARVQADLRQAWQLA